MKTGTGILLSIFLLCFSCAIEQEEEAPILYREVPNAIVFENTLKSTKKLNILNYLYYYNGAGMAIGDFNNDSLDDIYLVANESADQLFINKGQLHFENSTEIAQIDNATGWTTGVTTVDINADGLLDIYISKVSGHLHLKGANLLYVNQGVDANGIPRFKNEAAQYGLALSGLVTQSAFFDYDLDGDLDAFILNHSVHPNANYARGVQRYKRDSLNGDKLLRNDNGIFKDISQEAGILQNKISYGLGLGIADINNDNYPDIFIGNDFFENDYLYINQKDGSFKEVNTIANQMGHTTHFSMGNDMADINNDGLIDIVAMDMLPEDVSTLKASGTEYSYPIYQNQLRNGYQPQFMQNTLHLNQGKGNLAEVAFASGIAATEWSWAPLLADLDNDGLKDIYITNGILGATNDMDFINFISNDAIQKKLGKGMLEEDLKLITKLPPKKTTNYFYKNSNGTTFIDMTSSWAQQAPSYSNGAAYSDLDNDGDLDIITNNVNENVTVLENLRNTFPENNYINIQLKGTETNTMGIGAKVHLYTAQQSQYFENYTTRGYLSSVPPTIFAGLGQHSSIDSIRVIWPEGKQQLLTKISANQTIVIEEKQGVYKSIDTTLNTIDYLASVASPISFTHQDAVSIAFSRDPLIPYANTNLGPQIKTFDLNSDGLDDIITLGAKGQSTGIWLQDATGSFSFQPLLDAQETAIHEDTCVLIFDANGDQKNDIIIGSGGDEFISGKPLQPRLYLNTANGLQRQSTSFENIIVNASSITAVDFDGDGDQDVCITANLEPRQFGVTPQQYLFRNDGSGNFEACTTQVAPEFQSLGNVTDIAWVDVNNDGLKDAIVVGHWMPVSLFLNDGKQLHLQNKNGLSQTHGWWNTITSGDFDKDGDIDFIAGNWGLNTRLRASVDQPITLYRNDFDRNGSVEPIVTYFYQDQETTIATKDELVKQLPEINKRFLSYNAFAKADISQIFTKKKLQDSDTNKCIS